MVVPVVTWSFESLESSAQHPCGRTLDVQQAADLRVVVRTLNYGDDLGHVDRPIYRHTGLLHVRSFPPASLSYRYRLLTGCHPDLGLLHLHHRPSQTCTQLSALIRGHGLLDPFNGLLAEAGPEASSCCGRGCVPSNGSAGSS